MYGYAPAPDAASDRKSGGVSSSIDKDLCNQAGKLLTSRTFVGA